MPYGNFVSCVDPRCAARGPEKKESACAAHLGALLFVLYCLLLCFVLLIALLRHTTQRPKGAAFLALPYGYAGFLGFASPHFVAPQA